MQVGGQTSLQIYNASGTVSVSSSNQGVAVAEISNNQVMIAAKAAGTAKLTVKDRYTTLYVTVTVKSASITASPTSVSLAPGQTATVTISNVTGTLTASSASTAVATAAIVSGSLRITAVAGGSTTVTAHDSGTNSNATVGVTVTATKMSVSPTSVSLVTGQTATVTISNAQGTLSATPGSSTIATATISGSTMTITGKSAGSTSITVSDTKTTASVAVTVSASTTTTSSTYTLTAWNDLGMHCMDADYSVFSILPPYNNLHAQLVDNGNNKLVTSGVTLTYESMKDSTGSINTYSATASNDYRKTNFWQYITSFFGTGSPSFNTGLTGNTAPGTTPKPLKYDSTSKQFVADGIPLTPVDDSLAKNYYPMVKVVAKDGTGKQLAQARVVLPVSDEMSCVSCHSSSSKLTAAMPTGGWVTGVTNPERAYRLNILRLHDQKQANDSLYATALAAKGYSSSGLEAQANSGKPILCAACHSSNALPGTGYTGVKPLTEAIHGLHAKVTNPSTGILMNDSTDRSACYQCHPGSATKCLRGVMGNAKTTSGALAIDCQSCHSKMSDVGRTGRVGWLDEPNCQSCHHDGLRDLSAVDSNGILKTWLDTRFATTPNAPQSPFSLYRFSSGHGSLQCEACHGATHAVYPSSLPSDNMLSVDVQGHTGTISECTACHKTVPVTATGGPHGLHTVGSAWVSGHQSYAKNNPASCTYCHGSDYRGTNLSTAKMARTLSWTDDGVTKTKTLTAGQKVGCYDCHNGPNP
jgi:hypothetical protein